MAAMSTVLKEFSDDGNSRTYALSTHSWNKPQLVLQKRKVPSGAQVVAEDTVTVLSATSDADGLSLPSRVSFSVTVRRPINGDNDDVTAMLAIFRDIVAGDEFANVVGKQWYLS